MYDWHKKAGKAYITSGTGYGKTELAAFDAAELDANIIATNAVKATSFVPPGWKLINGKTGLEKFTRDGAFLPMAYACAISDSSRVAASIVVGVNKDSTKASIIMEHAGVDITQAQSLQQSETGLEEAFHSRDWEINKLEQAAVEAFPVDNLHACVLVAVVFVIE